MEKLDWTTLCTWQDFEAVALALVARHPRVDAALVTPDHLAKLIAGLPIFDATAAGGPGEEQLESVIRSWSEKLPLTIEEARKIRTWAHEFPDFDAADLPDLPDGFVDESWHNDACPSFVRGSVTVFTDHADPARRLSQALGYRFSVWWRQDVELDTDDWAEVEAKIRDLDARPPLPRLSLKTVKRIQAGAQQFGLDHTTTRKEP